MDRQSLVTCPYLRELAASVAVGLGLAYLQRGAGVAKLAGEALGRNRITLTALSDLFSKNSD